MLAQKNFNIMVNRVNSAKQKGICDDETERLIKDELVGILNSTTLSATQKVNTLKDMENKYPNVLSLILFV
jgi:hypothetical protein